MPKPSKALIAKWDKKLAKSGFRDIEDRNYGDDLENAPLKRWDSSYMLGRTRTQGSHIHQFQQEYYSRCTQFAQVYKFTYKYEQQIWEMYSEGASTYTIVKALPRYSRTKIYKIIKRLELGMKEWIRHEQNY